ncbi:hypothetical protein D3C80_1771670 [compost metagenome]
MVRYDMLRSRSSRGDQRNRIIIPTGTIIAPAAPWHSRARHSCNNDPARAQASDARVNSTMASTNRRRGPKRSAAQPLTGTASAAASMYSDTTRFMRTLATPNSMAICGKAVITTVASISSIRNAQPIMIGTRRD